MKYHTNSVPPFYKCSACGVSGVKLWRQYSVCADYVRLLCAPCGCADQKIEDNVDDQGKAALAMLDGQRCDQLNSLVPAVPTEDEHTYWGYTSVPEEGVQWWKRLPTRSCTQDVQAERERCAKICEDVAKAIGPRRPHLIALACAKRIRGEG